jgi:hypothetical protein
MQLLNDGLERFVKTDMVEAMEAYDRSIDKEDMAKRLKALGHDVEAAQALATASRQQEVAAAQRPAPSPAAAPASAPAPAPGSPGWKRPGA